MSARIDTPVRKAGDVLLSAALCAMISLPLVVQWTRPFFVDGTAPQVPREFRKPAEKPELALTRESLLAFPSKFGAWFNDAFGLRGTLIRWHNVVKLAVLGVSPTSELVVGDDLWLYTTRDHAVDVYRGLYPFTEAELALWQRVLEERRDWLAERGIAYVFAVGPNKESIYPERWPAELDRVGPTRLEQLLAYLEHHSDFRVLDLRPALLAAKRDFASEGDVFFQLGTHWNDRGALYAYEALMAEVAKEVPAAKARPRSAFAFEPTDFQDDSWASRLYMEDMLWQPNVEIVQENRASEHALEREIDVAYEVPDAKLPSAVFFHDSYGQKIRPLVAQDFRRIVCKWDSDFDTAIIEREHPDVVIQLFVERALVAYQPNTSPRDTPERLANEFDASRDVLFDMRSAPASLVPQGKLEIVRVENGEGAALVLRNGGGVVELPRFHIPADAWAVVRIEIECPAAGPLDLEFLTARESTYSRARGVRRQTELGRNEVWIKLLVPDLRGALRLRPGAVAGDYVLHALEIRAVRG